MHKKEWSHLWHHDHLDLNLFQAFFRRHAYPRHSHDYYVIALVERGLQSFTCAGTKYVTPVGGLILLNPADAHTGEPADAAGFEYLALYPTAAHMASALAELTERCARIPHFPKPRADDQRVAQWLRSLHAALKHDQGSLECESRLIWTLVQIIKRFADMRYIEREIGNEHKAVQRVRSYIQETYAQNISLSQLAKHVNLSRYYLLRVFRDAVGMPPHTYLESIRIQKAQNFIAEGLPLAQVAQRAGFSSQSHFTQRFKQIIGITPGKYAQQLKL